MLTEKCVKEYRKLFSNDTCAFHEPGSGIFIVSKASNKCFISPLHETEDNFMERLERCKKENYNFFYDEWKEFNYEKGNVY